jgi:hypothetical protein
VTPYHCSLFVEGGGLAIHQFRDCFTAAEFAADSNAVYRDPVGEGSAMMYSFRTATAPSIEQFSLLAEHCQP